MDTGDLSQVREFLLMFNKLSERCFQRCVYSLGQSNLQADESSCIDTCITKSVNFNQKIFSLYMDINPPFQQKKMEEQQAQIAEMQKSMNANLDTSAQA